jgi:hypothetical protein
VKGEDNDVLEFMMPRAFPKSFPRTRETAERKQGNKEA